jgi:hypothetical protein
MVGVRRIDEQLSLFDTLAGLGQADVERCAGQGVPEVA